MKKFITAILIATMSFSLVACGNKSTNNSSSSNETTTEGAVNSAVKNATDVLLGAYDDFAEALAPSYEMSAEELKTSFTGGYYDENDETTLTQGPGAVPVTNATITSIGLLSEDSLSMIDDASLLMHPMMTNYFAAMAFHVTEEANVDTVAKSLSDAILNNQWMCGQPEGYVVIKVDSYVVSMYGLFDNINAFKAGIIGAFENAVIVDEGAFVD